MGEEGRVGGGEGTIRKPMIEPKRSRGAVINCNKSDGEVGVEFIIDNAPEEAGGAADRGVKGGGGIEQPFFPASLFSSKKFVDELHQ